MMIKLIRFLGTLVLNPFYGYGFNTNTNTLSIVVSKGYKFECILKHEHVACSQTLALY